MYLVVRAASLFVCICTDVGAAATQYHTLQHKATRCNTLQHDATYCNAPACIDVRARARVRRTSPRTAFE